MNLVKAVSKNDLFSWISKAIEEESFVKYDISLDGTSEKCDGYIGEIVFVKVTGKTVENKEKKLNLVVKHSKQNDFLRASVFGIMFDVEIYFYNKVYPLMEKFQLEKNVTNIFEAVPKCLKTLCLGNKEVLVLENLKTQGYELHDRRKPLNLFHIKAVLEEIGKFHAISFALRDQKKKDFEALMEDYPNFFGSFLRNNLTKGCFKIAFKNALDTLLDHGEVELVEKIKAVLPADMDLAELMAKIVDEDEPQSVIVHGDGWNNNFLFKYKGGNRTSPSDVVILDWQLSYLRSPALDLSYIFYSTASAKELKHFEQLMKVYYESFATFLRALGSNPEELFPFKALKQHWRRYSIFALIFSSLLLAFVLCDKENAPAFEDLQDENSVQDLLIIDVSKNELYFQRFRDIARHYFECTF